MSGPVERYREAFERSRDALPGSGRDWLEALRRSALEGFESVGFPAPRAEDWKYTRTAAIEKQAFRLAEENAEVDATPFLLPASAAGVQMVFVDGRYREDLSRCGEPPAGVRLRSLSDALAQGDAATEATLRRFLRPDAPSASGFGLLNTAFTAEGVVLALDEAVRLEAPLHLLFLGSGTLEAMAHPRIIIDCAPGAAATVIEHYASAADGASFNNAVTQIRLGAGAALEHYKLQREAGTAFHVSRMDVTQEADSRFVSHSVNLGAALARHDINVSLDAPGAACTLNGLYVGQKRQHVDYHTRVDHVAPGCTSDEDYRGILDGRSRGVFNGRVYVHPDAQKSDATQSNRNLLLSRNAEVDTKPQLEIHANDVKCAHGATVGQLDARMIFYLRSRGIAEADARALLTYGFARDLLERMRIEAIRDVVSESLLERLPRAGELKSMLS